MVDMQFTNVTSERNFSLLIVVFAKNEKVSVLKTLNSLIRAVRVAKYAYKVVYVDDYSKDGTVQMLKNSILYLNNSFEIIEKNKNDMPGIKNCIKIAMDKYESDQVLAVPGHYMFDSYSIKKILQSIEPNTLVIGVRTNLYKSRPYLKFLAAKLFHLIFNLTLKTKQIKDPHGLNSYPYVVLKSAFPLMSSHENHVIPITIALKNKLAIKNIPIKVRHQHKKEGQRRRSPRIKDVSDSFCNLIMARKLMNGKHIKQLN